MSSDLKLKSLITLMIIALSGLVMTSVLSTSIVFLNPFNTTITEASGVIKPGVSEVLLIIFSTLFASSIAIICKEIICT
jgi:hypothetical protein